MMPTPLALTLSVSTVTALLAAAAPALAHPAPAQQALLFATGSDEVLLDGASGLATAAEIAPDELAYVIPAPGGPSARPFLPVGTQWAYLGDADGDGRLVDSSTSAPGDDTDAVFLKRAVGVPTGPVGPRDVFVSKEGTAGLASGVEDGDVYRFADQGTLEVFVTEAQLLSALGQGVTGDLDLDAICQSEAGDLFVSFEFTEDVNGVPVEDGGIVILPASGLTYDAAGNVASVTPATAAPFLDEATISALIAGSGVATSVGGSPSTSIDVTALELDAANSTPGGVTNLLFAWSGFSNDGAVLSTAGGGTIASLNGVPLGSTQATTGTQIGLLPDSTGLDGLAGIAIADLGLAGPTLENHPTNLITSSTVLFSRRECSGASPGGPVVFVVDVGPTGPGAVLPAGAAPGFDGEAFGVGSLIVLGVATADGAGYASRIDLLPPSLVGSGVNLVFQAVDLFTSRLSDPAPLQFL